MVTVTEYIYSYILHFKYVTPVHVLRYSPTLAMTESVC